MSRLRPWDSERDAAAVLAAFLGSLDLHRQAPPIETLDDARDYLTAIAADALAIDQGGEAVGCVMAAEREPVHGTAWMSYWLAPAARGRGLASRALDTLSRRLFAHGLHRLELGARANNPASIAVAERAGYVREGVERERLRYVDEHGLATRFDVVRFARLATDPAPDLEPLAVA
ncbi:GNAT family protein [Agrococcus sp. Marseille-Q4369]|uniref:GNAT family N-acetyltransferase n=1 Tax=Agrococcus sp. Marseille-Q4369 TaxID=2810513 RepID=UPI001B8C35F5|nr:GNAT family protein [Agrococcus sp. Marseille-Q4369]QUW19873.1 GNAT family N-acetyltransferase [Agrococcus sp. Marseille-Q4369]